MTFCRNCGKKNPDESKYCSGCGNKIWMESVNEQKNDLKEEIRDVIPQKSPIIYALPTKRSSSHKGLAILVVVLLIAAGVGYYFVDNYGHHAQIGFYVYSTHATQDVDVIVYIDGEEVFSYQDLAPGYYCYNTYYHVYNFSLFEDAKLITIKAVSTGGGLGTQTDSESIIVHNGQKYNVDLYV